VKAAFALAALVASAAAMSIAPGPAAAQQGERIRRVVIFGNQVCPRGSAGEVVICARRPSTERFRIPPELRDEATADDPKSMGWADRAQSLEYVGRTGIQSCSTSGAGGSTGCFEQLVRTWRGERAKGSAEPGR
jgi:hypothetical protein